MSLVARSSRPWYQHAIVVTVALLVAFSFAGALLDATSNAHSLVPARVALLIATVLVGGTLALHPILRRWPLPWVAREGTTIRIAGLGPRAVGYVAGIVLLLFVPVLAQLVAREPRVEPLPLVSVRLVNVSSNSVVVAKRAECVFWLPSGFDDGAPRTNAKCELVTLPASVDPVIVVPPNRWLSVRAKLMNEERFRQLFRGGEADLTVIVQAQGSGSRASGGGIPFTRPDLERYFVEIDVSPRPRGAA